MRFCRIVALATLIGLAAKSASGQFEQYIAPGAAGLPTVSNRESLEKSIGNAPWRLGSLRLQPWIGIRDVGYVNNVLGPGREIDDVTAAVALGVKAYLPMGPKVILAAHFLPEYVWWRETEELRGWHHQIGVGAFAYFNRLTVEARGTSTDLQRYLSAEVEAPATVRSWNGDVVFEVDVAGPIAFFGSASQSDFEHDDEGFDIGFETPLGRLDRVERTASAGVKWKRQEWSLGLGGAWSEADFEGPVRDRSNSGIGPLLVAGYSGARWSASGRIAQRDLEARDGSGFTRYDDVSGQAQIAYSGRSRFGASAYGVRNLVYAVSREAGYFDDLRYGVTAGYLFGWRTDLRLFLEMGENDYVGFSGADVRRVDDVLSYGGNLQFKVLENSTIVLGFTRSDYDSNIDANDREITTLRVGVNVGGRMPW